MQGETDWKPIAIDVNDPLAENLNDIHDVDKIMPGFLKVILLSLFIIWSIILSWVYNANALEHLFNSSKSEPFFGCKKLQGKEVNHF